MQHIPNCYFEKRVTKCIIIFIIIIIAIIAIIDIIVIIAIIIRIIIIIFFIITILIFQYISDVNNIVCLVKRQFRVVRKTSLCIEEARTTQTVFRV